MTTSQLASPFPRTTVLFGMNLFLFLYQVDKSAVTGMCGPQTHRTTCITHLYILASPVTELNSQADCQHDKCITHLYILASPVTELPKLIVNMTNV
ncbi:hypothetical protein BaRGS_00026588 [Batillaria attramentaria]|uniref:Secreted protein n=1 Tax=Batillaria attramentaria TaxID=370345 RepID=A0ABD0K575_9CAEN